MDIVSLGKITTSIRWMTSKDVTQLVNICDNDLDWKMPDFKTYVKKKDNVILVATLGAAPVAFAAFEKNEDNVFISALVVDKTLRRRNVGTQLIQRIKFGFLKNGRTDCEMVVNEKNTGMHLFLQENDFKAVKVIRYFFDDDSGYLFRFSNENFGGM